VALAPAFAAGLFALQRLLEILDPDFEKLNNAQLKKILLGPHLHLPLALAWPPGRSASS